MIIINQQQQSQKRQRGFSLIEIMIVLVIMGTLMSFVAGGRKSSVQKEYKRFFRRFSTMSKEMRSRAQIKGTTLRLIFKLEDEKPIEFWAEEAKGKVLLSDSKKTEEMFKDIYNNLDKAPSKLKKDKEKQKKKHDFKKIKKFTSKRLYAPKALTIKQIEINGLEDPIDEEIAFFHFLPEGFVEEVAIQIQTIDEELKWTLSTDPLTGEMIILNGHIDLEKLQDRD